MNSLAAHHQVQWIVVRMLYDETFARATLRNPMEALLREGLGDREAKWLSAIDPRALKADPLRTRHTLQTLLEEFKASSALVLQDRGRFAVLEDFFGSPEFHREIQARGSLVEGFASYLLTLRLSVPHFQDVVGIEAMLARCRRAFASAGADDFKFPQVPKSGTFRVQLAPGVGVGRYSPNALSLIQTMETFLFEAMRTPIMILAEDRPRLVLPTPTEAKPVTLGFVPTHAALSLVELDEPTFALLDRLQKGSCLVSELEQKLVHALLEDEVLMVEKPAPKVNTRS